MTKCTIQAESQTGAPSSNSIVVTIPVHHTQSVPESGSLAHDSLDMANSSSEQNFMQEVDSSGSLTVSQPSETTHSLPITASMLPVLDPAQLEVHIPFDTPLSSELPTDHSVHRMRTRLQIGTIQRKDYSSYIASLPQLTTLQIDDQDPYAVGGFSFVSQCSDVAEPTSFKSAATSTHWQKAM
ncbi:hypothetical protein ACFX15_036761 [Malus domestica]